MIGYSAAQFNNSRRTRGQNPLYNAMIPGPFLFYALILTHRRSARHKCKWRLVQRPNLRPIAVTKHGVTGGQDRCYSRRVNVYEQMQVAGRATNQVISSARSIGQARVDVRRPECCAGFAPLCFESKGVRMIAYESPPMPVQRRVLHETRSSHPLMSGVLHACLKFGQCELNSHTSYTHHKPSAFSARDCYPSDGLCRVRVYKKKKLAAAAFYSYSSLQGQFRA